MQMGVGLNNEGKENLHGGHRKEYLNDSPEILPYGGLR